MVLISRPKKASHITKPRSTPPRVKTSLVASTMLDPVIKLFIIFKISIASGNVFIGPPTTGPAAPCSKNLTTYISLAIIVPSIPSKQTTLERHIVIIVTITEGEPGAPIA